MEEELRGGGGLEVSGLQRRLMGYFLEWAGNG